MSLESPAIRSQSPYRAIFSEWIFTFLAIVFCAIAAYSFADHRMDPAQAKGNGTEAVKGAVPVQVALKPTVPVAPAAAPGKQEETVQHADRKGFRIASSIAGAWILLWGMFAFTGDPEARRIESFKFAYFFVAASFAVFALPPLLKSQAIGSEPIGIVSGCVTDIKASEQIRCPTSTSVTALAPTAAPSLAPSLVDASATVPAPLLKVAASVSTVTTAPIDNNQWLVNIGGALTEQTAVWKTTPCPEDQSACKPGSTANRVNVSGGLVVPLPFVIIALMGGAISLSRRVPEIQKSSDPTYVATATQPAYMGPEARDRLVFQIVQFVSAPMIAIVAYQIFQPDSDASAAGLAFMCGFGSEAILLLIRGFVEGIRPRVNTTGSVVTSQAGVIGGTVTGKEGAVADAEVTVTGSTVKIRSDSQGRYALQDVPAGAQKLTGTKGIRTVTVNVTVPAGGSITQALILDDGGPPPPPPPPQPQPLPDPGPGPNPPGGPGNMDRQPMP